MSPTWTRMQTLGQRSSDVRIVRSTIKRELKSCPDKRSALALVAQHIEDPVPELAAMSVYDLIAAGRSCGQGVAYQILDALKISAFVKVGQPGEVGQQMLTERQRSALVAALTGQPEPRPVRATPPKPRPVAPPPAPLVALTPKPSTPGPSLAHWCPRCGDYALAMRNGLCGWCDTPIAAPALQQRAGEDAA
jgi:hypothetical protein